MTSQADHDVLSYVTGEVHALLLFTQALVGSHPNPSALLMALDTLEQKGIAQIEAEPISDATLSGFRYVVDALRETLRLVEGTRRTAGQA